MPVVRREMVPTRQWRLLLVALALPTLAIAAELPAQASGGTTTGADLQMSGSASNGGPPAGAAFTYTFQVKNAGPQTATGATFVDSNYNAADVISAVAVNGDPTACAAGSDSNAVVTWTCSLGDMPSGTQVNIVENATAPTLAGIYDNTPSVTSSVSDPNLANNAATAEIKIGGGGGTTTTLVNAPCAKVTAQNPPTIRASTNQGAQGSETMNASVTSCSALVQPNLVVTFVPTTSSCTGCAITANDYAFTCTTPVNQNGSPDSFTLSPGATVGVSCTVPFNISAGLTVSGLGAASLYSNCVSSVSGLLTASDLTTPCSSSQILAAGTYSWSIFTDFAVKPAPPPTCPRAGCVVF